MDNLQVLGSRPSVSSALDPTVQALLAPGKGILAADESYSTIGRRFAAAGIDSTEETRRAYREILFTTPGLGGAIGGAILFGETLRQKTRDGAPFAAILESQGIVTGVKVDLGTIALPNFPGERITEGLDNLSQRLEAYRGMGARFTKWRAVINVGQGRPGKVCLEANAILLALFAALSQQAGLVPIVEPEVLMDGDHSLERAEQAANLALQAVFTALRAHQVRLEEMLLKVAMVLPGAGSSRLATDEEVAASTLRCLHCHVPAAVPGIVFLSGGQGPAEATRRLAAICRANRGPWAMSFSFGRALQEAALGAWGGRPENVSAAQAKLAACARQNAAALTPSS
jgi:fructose-bisphosphate aldolase class I